MNLISEEYERALLGAILMDSRVLEEYPLSADFFGGSVARKVFETVQALQASGAVPNLVEVARRMPDGAAYIATLTDTITAANVGFYVAELTELYRKRGIVKLARDMTDMVRDFENNSGDILTAVDKALVDIAMNREAGYKPVTAYIEGTIADVMAAYNAKGALSGIDTGFPELNQKTNGWQKQTLNIIGARPGAGKTSIALNMASSAMRTGKCVGFFSAEMSASSLVKRMVSDWGSVEYARLNSGFLCAQDLQRMEEAFQRIAERNLFLNDTPNVKLPALIADSRRMRRKERVDIIFIDYLSLVANERKDIPRHEQVAEISRTLKGLSRELDIPIVVLSQLTREAQGERPKLSQLRDSGAVEQDADTVALLWNRGYSDDTHSAVNVTFILEKNRNGATGDIPMIFKPSRMNFKQLEEGK